MFFWSPYIRSYEKKMIEANKKYWGQFQNVTDSGQWIYVLHEAGDLFVNGVHKDIVAKGIQEQTKLPIASIMYGWACNQLFKELDQSFGIENNHALIPEEMGSWISGIKIKLISWILAYRTYGNKDKLFKMKYRGINCGDAIHDTILRMRGKKKVVFDCFDIDIKEYCGFIQEALNTIDSAFKFFRIQRPRYIITSNPVFNWELVPAVSRKFGAEILCIAYDKPETIVRISLNQNYEKEIKTQKLIRTQIENYLEVKGESVERKDNLEQGQDFFVYKNDSNGGASALREMIPDNGYKNVFIMPHCLSDAPRANTNLEVYRDYNEWYVDTLQIASKIPNVNWIVKEHPMASFYKQDAYVKRVFEENKTENMFWCDKYVSGNCVREIADCVITCAGDVGIEYWTYGIPTITLSETYYSHLGISYNIKSKEEYKKVLQKIDQLPLPSLQSVESAQRYILALKQMQQMDDDLSKLFSNTCRQEIASLNSGNWEEFNSDIRYKFCHDYITQLNSNNLLDSKIFLEAKNSVEQPIFA